MPKLIKGAIITDGQTNFKKATKQYISVLIFLRKVFNRCWYLGVKRFEGKPVQEWFDWDGLGPYKYRPHYYSDNRTLKAHSTIQNEHYNIYYYSRA